MRLRRARVTVLTHKCEHRVHRQQHAPKHHQDRVLGAEAGEGGGGPCVPRAAVEHPCQSVVHGQQKGLDGQLHRATQHLEHEEDGAHIRAFDTCVDYALPVPS